MIPNLADPATELFHWQRYLYFRPWYAGKRVIDAASGEGYGTAYAATFASEATGFDIGADAVAHARRKYDYAQFKLKDVCEVDYSAADLVVTDLNMPVMDGLTLIRELRKLPAYQGIPILFLTTESDPEKKKEAKSAGATGWITKPFQQEQLVSVVKKVLGA